VRLAFLARRCALRSARELIPHVDRFVTHHNVNCTPLLWITTAGSINVKLEGLCAQISGAVHTLALQTRAPQ
jgi:putative transposase